MDSETFAGFGFGFGGVTLECVFLASGTPEDDADTGTVVSRGSLTSGAGFTIPVDEGGDSVVSEAFAACILARADLLGRGLFFFGFTAVSEPSFGADFTLSVINWLS